MMNIKLFRYSLIITIFLSVVLFSLSGWYGKVPLFLLFNTDLGFIGDKIFLIGSFLGEGIWWVVLLVLFFFFRKKFIPLLITVFIVSTLIVQVFKWVIIPDEPRPVRAIADKSLYHCVPGVELNTVSSFPSGHTTQAFCFFMLACLLMNNPVVLPVGLLGALWVGYSRIYLAQHFPFDVAGGMLSASLTMLISLWLMQVLNNKKRKVKL